MFDAHAKGTLQGAAGIGTAAVIAPLGRLRHKDREITIPAMGPDSPLMRAGAELEGDPLGQDRRSPQLVDVDLDGIGIRRFTAESGNGNGAYFNMPGTDDSR